MDQASRDVKLDFFVLFSSVAAALGNVGQADYACANGFMDQFAEYRNGLVAAGERHGRTRSINWGLWQAGGMRIDEKTQELAQQTTGLQPMQTERGLAGFYCSMALPYDQMLVAEGNLSKITTSLQPSRSFIPPSDLPATAPHQYANKAEEFYSHLSARAPSEFTEAYLTFAPFEKRKPGFSVSKLSLTPEKCPGDASYVLSKQIEMRQVLFCKEDFKKLTSVLDFGCGYGTDIIQIGELFPHIRAHGYTITRDQAILGNHRLSTKGLDTDRVKLYHKDSSEPPFLAQYDLVFGVEVSFHIRNKIGLFSNISQSLTKHGRILLIDYISNLPGPVEDPTIEITIPNQKAWAMLTAQFQLEIDEIIDVSPEIANFLYDPDLKDNIAGLPVVSQKSFTNYANQAVSLEKGWLSYVLIKLKRNQHWSQERIERHNLDKIQHSTPYAVALKAMLEQQDVHYPPRKVLSGYPSVGAQAEIVACESHQLRAKDAVSTGGRNPFQTETKTLANFNELQQQLKVILAKVLRINTIDY